MTVEKDSTVIFDNFRRIFYRQLMEKKPCNT